mgnify:CR=1 FL=1
MPHDAYPSFLALGRGGVLDPALAVRLAPAAGLGNRLVQEYDALDDGRALAAVRDARRDFGAYVAAVERCLGDGARGRRAGQPSARTRPRRRARATPARASSPAATVPSVVGSGITIGWTTSPANCVTSPTPSS